VFAETFVTAARGGAYIAAFALAEKLEIRGAVSGFMMMAMVIMMSVWVVVTATALHDLVPVTGVPGKILAVPVMSIEMNHIFRTVVPVRFSVMGAIIGDLVVMIPAPGMSLTHSTAGTVAAALMVVTGPVVPLIHSVFIVVLYSLRHAITRLVIILIQGLGIIHSPCICF